MNPLAFLRSVRSQVVALVIVALTPAFLLMVLTAGQQRAALVERTSDQNVELARAISASQGELIESARILLTTIADTPAIQEHRRDECNAMAQRIIQAATAYVALAAADPDGMSWCRYPQPDAVSDGSKNEYFVRALETRAFAIGGFQIGQVTRRRVLTVAAPVLDAQGKVISMLALGLDVDELNRRIDGLGLAPDYSVLLVDRDGTLIIDWPKEADTVGEQVPAGAFRDALLTEHTGAHPPQALIGPDGVERLYAFRSVDHTPDQDLTIAVGIELGAALRPVDQAIWLSFVLGVSLLLLGGVSAWWFGDRRLAWPIRSLAQAARQIQSGRLDSRAQATGQASEIAGLVADFNAMADTLETQAADLMTANQTLERRVESRTQQLKASFDELRRSREQLRRLSGRQRQMLEEEQTRISREVHDQLGQSLTGAKMDLALIERRLRGHATEPAVAEAIDVARALTELMDETIQVARAIARRLRPSLLDDLGLAAAIEWMARDVAGRSGLNVTMNADEGIARLPEQLGTATYRIAQEAVTNIVRHARAHTVAIDLRREGDGLRLTITDDGIGLPQDDAATTSLGLLGMRERAEEMGGTIVWEPGAAGGTRVNLLVPIETTGSVAGATPAPATDHAEETQS